MQFVRLSHNAMHAHREFAVLHQLCRRSPRIRVQLRGKGPHWFNSREAGHVEREKPGRGRVGRVARGGLRIGDSARGVPNLILSRDDCDGDCPL